MNTAVLFARSCFWRARSFCAPPCSPGLTPRASTQPRTGFCFRFFHSGRSFWFFGLRLAPKPQDELMGQMNNRRSKVLLGALTLAALLPFLNKAYDIDDPLFLWMGQQIMRHPLDPYGGIVHC